MSLKREGGLYEEVAGSVAEATKQDKEQVKEEIKHGTGQLNEYNEYSQFTNAISKEVSEVLSKVDPNEVSLLMDEILKAEKIFVIGVGRVFLSLQCLAKRLAHFGFDINLVGSVVEKRITDKDLLLVASGSGESKLPAGIAEIAKKYNARIALITSSKESTIKSIANVAVHLPCPTKTDYGYGVKSIQTMSTLFDQSLHLFGDILCLMLQKRTGKTNEDLKKFHANLE
jgi:6-phospho-3-hexuloisomerase